jgi:hypothetical protein
MFWKKKASPLLAVFKSKYICLAPNYLKEVFSDEGGFYDADKEKLHACLQNRELSQKDIDQLNARYEFDIWKGMVWIDAAEYKRSCANCIESTRYRLIDYANSLSPQTISKVMEYFNFELFYHANDIALVSGMLGRDLLLECIWEKYTKVTLKVESRQTEYNFYRKENKRLVQA